MDNRRKMLDRLLEAYENDTCTAEERAYIDRWLAKKNAIRSTLLSMDSERRSAWLEELYTNVRRRRSNTNTVIYTRMRRRRFAFVAAVAAMLVCVLGGLWYNISTPDTGSSHRQLLPFPGHVVCGSTGNTNTFGLTANCFNGVDDSGNSVYICHAETPVTAGEIFAPQRERQCFCRSSHLTNSFDCCCSETTDSE